MRNRLLLYLLVLLVLCSIVFGITKPYISEVPEPEKSSNLITGNIVFESKPNNVQKVYMQAIPSVVKIIVYVDFDRFLPNIEYIDWDDYNRKIERGLEPTYDDLDIDYDASTNYYDLLEDEYGEEYGSDVENYPYSVGSGFIINPEGYVVTNAHVLAIDNDKTKEILRNQYIMIQQYGMEEAYAYEPEYTTDDYLDDWALLNFMIEKLEIRNLRIKTKVVVGVDKPGQNLIVKEYTPKIIDYEGGTMDLETGFYDYSDFDWALLKVDGANLPSLDLGDSNVPSIGTQIIVIGYPFVSEETTSEGYYEFKTNIEPTLTTGYISQITTIEKNKYFQVDLSISEGNSGGPALDENGKVIGIVTMGLEAYAGGNYNYITRINDIKTRISDKVQPRQSEIDNLWNQALTEYWNEDYISAKDNFEAVLELNPIHPYVKNVLSTVKNKAETQQPKPTEVKQEKIELTDEEPVAPTQKENNGFSIATMMLIGIGIIIIVLLIILISKKRR